VFFFIPLGTTRPHWRTPWATYGLMAVCVCVFVYQLGHPEAIASGFVPAHPTVGGWMAGMLLHAGAIHLLGNMLFLWLFGTLAEDVLGPWLFLAFYFGGNVGATLLDWLMTAAFAHSLLVVPRIGASGAIAGIMGLSAVCFFRTKVRVWYVVGWLLYWKWDVAEISTPVFLGLWVGWEVLQGSVASAMGSLGDAAHWAHVGGFVVGLGGAVVAGFNKRVPREDLVTGRAAADTAVTSFQQAAELEKLVCESPEDADAWRALGRACELIGRLEMAKSAYQRSAILFLRQRRLREAGEAGAAMLQYLPASVVPAELHFDFACALEEANKPDQAFHVFRGVADSQPQTRQAETALMRAAEIARMHLHDELLAGQCYEALLRGYPYSEWRGLAQERLAELQLPKTRRAAPRQPAKEQGDGDLKPLGGAA
jgi:membrane associated rhomboid family serine protease